MLTGEVALPGVWQLPAGLRSGQALHTSTPSMTIRTKMPMKLRFRNPMLEKVPQIEADTTGKQVQLLSHR